MGKKKEGYIMKFNVRCDDFPSLIRSSRQERNLSKAILKTSLKKPKSKYAQTEGLPKEWR